MKNPNDSPRPGDLQANFEIFQNTTNMFTFLADPSGLNSPYTFLWDFGDGHMYMGSELWTQHEYKEKGIYTVSLTITATIYSGDTVSVSAPTQILEAPQNKDWLLTYQEDPLPNTLKQKDELDKQNLDLYITDAFSLHLQKNTQDDIFKGLCLDIDKLALRMATVIAADPIPENTNFLKLQVSTGSKKRTVITKHKELNLDSYIGRKVVLVTNLAPIALCEIKSQGLLLEDLGILETKGNHFF